MRAETVTEHAGEHASARWPGGSAALWLLIAILAWVQFPLGSARPWAWDLLVLLVALDWALWLRPAVTDANLTLWGLRQIALPALLLLAVMAWIFVQTAGWTPAAWHHAVWQIPSESLGRTTKGAVSLSPYVTATEGMKLLAYLGTGLLAYFLSLRHDYAHKIFVSIFVIGLAYAVYGIILSVVGTSQITLFEGLPPPYGRDVSGGLVAKNSFATFTGLSLLPGLSLFVSRGQRRIITEQGLRVHARTLIQYVTGAGSFYFTGIIILLGALIASDSRAGLIATFVGLFVMLVLAAILSAYRKRLKWTLLGGFAAASLCALLFVISGQNLQSRFASLIETAGIDDMRAVMWDAAIRAIVDKPLLGTGLGTYGSVYHLYADQFVPYVVDRVHNDYLEFVMGVGVPAAALWFLAFALLTLCCLRGIFRRQRRRLYALTAVGGLALVAFHSIFDFSLQMPAVSVLFAILFGVGIGQAHSTR